MINQIQPETATLLKIIGWACILTCMILAMALSFIKLTVAKNGSSKKYDSYEELRFAVIRQSKEITVLRQDKQYLKDQNKALRGMIKKIHAQGFTEEIAKELQGLI